MKPITLGIHAFFDIDGEVNSTLDPLSIDNANRIILRDVDSQKCLMIYDVSIVKNGHDLIIELDRDNASELQAALGLVLKTKGEVHIAGGIE